MIGLSYCLFGTANWAMIPYEVDDKMVGTAFGIAYAFENIGNVFGPIVMGMIADRSRESDGVINYRWVSIFLFVFSAIGMIMYMYLTYLDISRGGILMSPRPAER